ncbi:MAG: hypothetical protein QHG99_02955, partial [Methanomicrobiales archaeon]|nr:hypothetical protein [Methanomicrobiales archaeon]
MPQEVFSKSPVITASESPGNIKGAIGLKRMAQSHAPLIKEESNRSLGMMYVMPLPGKILNELLYRSGSN